MNPENRVMRKERNLGTSEALVTKTSDATQQVTVITVGSILKFVLFFMACFALSVLLVGWYLDYFERSVTR